MIAKYLWATGSIILLLLGSVHLYLTFFTTSFSLANEKLISDMKASSPILSQKITLWKAWIGFNGSHSSGLVFIGGLNAYLALRHFALLQADHFIVGFTLLTICFYVWLAANYWFIVPFAGLIIALICCTSAYILILINR